MAGKEKKPPQTPASFLAGRPTGEGSIRISPYWGVDFGDQSVWATDLVDAKHAKNKQAPSAADLENAITGIQINDSMNGASSVTVSFEDPGWNLIETGFFDANEDGRLDAMEVNYPADSPLWWRCTQIGIQADRNSASIDMVFMERTVAHLLSRHGPEKWTRGTKHTRAEFLNMLVGKVKATPLTFYCEQLHVIQEQEKVRKATAKKASGSTGGGLAWHPDATRVEFNDAGTFVSGAGHKIVHHTTEGSSIGGAESAYRANNSAPHFTFDHDSNTIHQHVPVTKASRSLQHTSGTPETNRAHAIQIEHVGFAATSGNWSDAAYKAIADLARWIENNAGVPSKSTVNWTSPSRLSGQAFFDYAGHIGHVHVPGNSHTDPGTGFKIALVLDEGLVQFGGSEPPFLDQGNPANRPTGTTTTGPNTEEAPFLKQPKPKRKKKGISDMSNITIEGKKIDKEQKDAIEVCMGVADDLNVSPKVVKSMVVAALGESKFRPSAIEKKYGTHKGVFQSYLIPQFDTKAQCTHFLQGGRSFLAGGAIGLVKAHPEYTVGTVAAKVEISDGSAGYYDGFAGKADEIIAAYGGGGSGTTTSSTSTEYRKSYNFEIGGPDHPNETYWDGMRRLAQEVKWALFVDGTDVFYDAETTLIRQKPAAYVDRLDETVVSFNANWDARQIATEATLELICDPFEFRAGDVLVLRNFGPASSGSSVKPPLPGRWLIDEVDRDRFDFVSTFRLKQPTHPGLEPAPDVGTLEEKDTSSSGGTAAKASSSGGCWPGVFPVTGAYGTQRPGHIHAGLDVGVPHGTDCTAPFDGTITYVSNSGFGVAGGMVHLRADLNVEGLSRGDKVGWGHCVDARVKVGDKVETGKVLAKSNGTPAHVHFVLLKKNGGGNGVDGNADPTAFLKQVGSISGTKGDLRW